MKLKIDKKVPLPSNARKTGLLAHLRALDVGDSFLWDESKRHTISNSAYNVVKIKISVRDEGPGMVRVWRTK